LWSGGIKVVWDKAVASNKNDNNVTASRSADQYSISLKKIGGKFHFKLRSISIRKCDTKKEIYLKLVYVIYKTTVFLPILYP